MNCVSCGRTNPPIARFCAACGTPVAPRCPTCGAEHEADARFCIACGASLGGRSAPATEEAEARKVVTIVFADLIGSTALHERLDPESVSRLMDRYYRTVRAPVEAHGGTVVQLLGDGVMCAFGVPRVAEDDAIRAVRAAVGMQQAFREFARDHAEVVGSVGLRVAVNTGEVVVSDDYAAGIGDPLNVAARLQQEARDGDVLIGESTERLVRDRATLERVGTFNLKGRAETVTAYRVVSLERPAGVPSTPFVGREAELGRLMAVYERALSTPAARLAVILGSPGLGKSRLLAELARRLENRATMLTARCEAAGGATFEPLAIALRVHLGVDDNAGGTQLRGAVEEAVGAGAPDHPRIVDGITKLLAGTPASPEETFFVIRRLLTGFARERPVVLAIDDLQWAEPLLLDLTEHLVQWGGGAPLLVLAAARPELRDSRSSLASPGGVVTDVITLTGLDAAAATRLAANVIGADVLPAAVAGRVLATSEGNPLFLGELVRMLVDDGTLKRDGDRWTAAVEVASIDIPPTIHALLAARIERLRSEERTVLERAAVVGPRFSRSALTHLLPREMAGLDARLEALKRSELIEADTGWFLGEPALRFHHALIRDAAYRRVLKGTRAELHGRLAQWIEARAGAGVEHDETIGWHLEQAHQNLRELGPLDEHGRAYGARAARHLGAAGRRSLARDDVSVAADLLGRALRVLDEADGSRPDLVLDWCEALLAAGDVAQAKAAVDELGRLAIDRGLGGYGVRGLGVAEASEPLTPNPVRLRAWHTSFAGRLAVLTDAQALQATTRAVAAAADELAAAGDASGEAHAHLVHALALSRLGKVGACEVVLDKALAAARRGDDRRRANTVLANAPLAALWGPSPVTRASGRCLDVVRVLRITQGAPAVEAVALRCQAVLEALRGRDEAARRMIESSRRMVEELGITQGLLETEMFAGFIALIEGDAAAAEQNLRAAYDGFRTHGFGIDAARAAGRLGRALLLQGRAAEAEALSHESEALAGDDLQAAITWRRVRAEALAQRGEHTAAVDFARAAVDIAAATDALLYHADARLGLAVALRAADRREEAVEEEARAVELWDAKGATVLAERARHSGGAPQPRFEELVSSPVKGLAAESAAVRHVRPNAATALAARLDVIVATRDAQALPELFAHEFRGVDHATHTEWDRQAVLSSWRSLMLAPDATCRHEPLATLGDSLALCRVAVGASGLARGSLDVGTYEKADLQLGEVDVQGRRSRVEAFAIERLGDAVVRLYERYADLLPEGLERARAAAIACYVATYTGPIDLDRMAAGFADEIEFVDRRPIGFGSVRGKAAFQRLVESLTHAAPESINRLDDVLGVRPDAMLLRITNAGTDRATGGAFERCLLRLTVFGSDGRSTLIEQFDPDREAEALARFEELTRSVPPGRQTKRRVRPNLVSAQIARLDAVMAARDADALAALEPEHVEVIDHPSGATYDRAGNLASRLMMLKAEDLTFRHEPLATLGESLGLFRMSMSAKGFTGARFDVGSYEREIIVLCDDGRGGTLRSELFAVDRLGDALVRLYEHYAESLPGGPARDRAVVTARSVAASIGPMDLDRCAPAFDPDVECVDHRMLGTWSAQGAEAVLGNLRPLLELTAGVVVRYDDVLALRSDAFLVAVTVLGTDRAGGGEFERLYLGLCAFGADGLLTRWEQFDVGREVEALARFEELTAEPSAVRPALRRVRPNAATASAARADAAIAARDVDGFLATWTDDCEAIDHPTGIVYGRRELGDTWRRAFLRAPDLVQRREELATLGETLALFRQWVSATAASGGRFEVGDYEIGQIFLNEVDAQGRCRRSERFAVDRLGDGVGRLYERYADLLPEGPEHERAATTARSVAAMLVARPNADSYQAALSPHIEFVDRRALGLPSGPGAEEYLARFGTLFEVAETVAMRVDDVLALRANALLVRWTNFGTARAGGGEFERHFLMLFVFGSEGVLVRNELFDADRDADALARFDALAGDAPGTATRAARIQNSATRTFERAQEALKAQDWERFAALFAPGFRGLDRRRVLQGELDRDEWLASYRAIVEMTSPQSTNEVIATRGDRLALARYAWRGSDGFVGPSEIEYLLLIEVDDRGEHELVVMFDPDDLDAAYAELEERHAFGEGAALASRRFDALINRRDWDALAELLAHDLVVHDHRRLGWGELRGPAAYLASLEALVDLAPDASIRVNHLRSSERSSLLVTTLSGTREGGEFEDRRIVVSEFDGRQMRRLDFYDLEQLDAARVRFAELGARSR